MATDTKRKILVITAGFVESTGTVSFKFMVDCQYPEVRNMPRSFGFVGSDHDGDHPINVFEGGRGLLMGGGWTGSDTDEWAKEMLDSVPSCTLLMSTETFEWWKELCAKHGVEFEHHHFEGGLKTS